MMTASELQQQQFYEPEEVQEILQMAIARKGEQGSLSREQLWEIAAELDIDPEYIEAAELQWLNLKKLNLKKQEFNLYRREQLQHSIVKYLIVNGFLLSLDLITTGGLSWSLYILFVWGLGVSLKTWKTTRVTGKAYEQAFESWYVRQEMKKSLGNFWQWVKKTWQILTTD